MRNNLCTLTSVLFVLLLAAITKTSQAFTAVHKSSLSFSSPTRLSVANAATTTTPPASSDSIVVLPTADAVGTKIRQVVQEAAQRAIQERGHFALAIPGGSILKMLQSSNDDNLDWTTKTTLVYVNHKCVSMTDENLATHAKAMKLFLKDWKGCQTILLDGTSQPNEASSYEAKLKALSQDVLPVNEQGLPVFDLALIGVGDDGHIGSLYPNRDEILVGPNGPWVLPVQMKDPPSITLSLPVMTAAKQVVVAACGVSEKYPQGKSEGMRRAILETSETLTSFPAVGLRKVATWVLDEAAASKL
jgi:6-phosphogluconolactonase